MTGTGKFVISQITCLFHSDSVMPTFYVESHTWKMYLNGICALISVAQLVGALSYNGRVVGLIPGQNPYLGCRSDLSGLSAYRRQPIDVSYIGVSLSLHSSL